MLGLQNRMNGLRNKRPACNTCKNQGKLEKHSDDVCLPSKFSRWACFWESQSTLSNFLEPQCCLRIPSTLSKTMSHPSLEYFWPGSPKLLLSSCVKKRITLAPGMSCYMIRICPIRPRPRAWLVKPPSVKNCFQEKVKKMKMKKKGNRWKRGIQMTSNFAVLKWLAACPR